MLNALTIDVEDYYHVSAFEEIVNREDWHKYESRVVQNTKRLLTTLSQYNVKSTFFVLGWIAENYPQLVKDIHREGHEVACHSYDHRLSCRHSHKSFQEDTKKARRILEEITGEKIFGYRAPTFSITNESLWTLQILEEEGFEYDSSIFPIRHDRYGIPQANRFPWRIQLEGQRTIKEFPLSTVRLFGYNIPVAGGGYLRLFPYKFIKWAIKRINEKEKQPAIIYIHPWEIDPDQPKQRVGLLKGYRHYLNLDKTEKKLKRLFQDFQWGRIKDILELSI